MGCQTCACDAGMSNTGAGCSTIFKDTYGLIGVQIYANDGTRNGIDLATATLNQAFFDALVNQADSSKRWYPIANDGGLKNVESVRENAVIETFTDGTKSFVRQGTKPFTGYITGKYANPAYIGKLEQVRCLPSGFGFYKIDRAGNLIGQISEDGGTLYPIEIDTQSFYPVFVEATPEQSAKIMFSFDFATTAADKDLAMIACAEIDGYDIRSIRGLLDIQVTFSNITTNGFRMALSVKGSGTVLNPVGDTGLTTADVTAYNTTDSAAVTIDSVSSVRSGVYDVTFRFAQTAGDEIVITPSKDGRDYSAVIATPFTIPAS